jgi:hypothetical protein
MSIPLTWPGEKLTTQGAIVRPRGPAKFGMVSPSPSQSGWLADCTGWDPIFEYQGTKTYAEMEKEEKVTRPSIHHISIRELTRSEPNLAPLQSPDATAALATIRAA